MADMDYVDSLGTSFFAHRLRRLSDYAVEQVSTHLTRAGLAVPARSVSTLLYLRENGPTGPVELGRALKFSHPLMVRSLRNLEALGLVEAVADESDQRRRRVKLTADGERESRQSIAITSAFTAEINRRAQARGIDMEVFSDMLHGLTQIFLDEQVEIPLPDEVTP